MGLSKDDIQELLVALDYGRGVIGDMWCDASIEPLKAELHRLTHGPLTLQEAVASGKPWREVGDIDVEFRLAPDDQQVIEIGCGGGCDPHLGCSSYRVRFQSRSPGGEWESIDINDDYWYIGDWVANPNAKFELVQGDGER